MPVKVTLLLAVTTNPTDPTSASAHSGGWSEGFYIPGSAFAVPAFFQAWAQGRALLLSGLASIIGYRQQLVTISGNKLLPGGTAAGTLLYPGSFLGDLNAPQDALMLNFQLAGQPSNLRHRLAALPDTQVSVGEYQPTALYKGNVTKYTNLISSGLFGAIVRDLTQPDARVRSLTAGALTTNTSTGAIVGQYLRFRRVKDSSGNPVEGAFLVTALVNNADGSVTYTLFDPPAQTVTTPNGTVRTDLLVFANIIGGVVNRLVVRKIGRPFVQYRGRRSKRRT